jgi:iron complex outermembrane receptor protein
MKLSGGLGHTVRVPEHSERFFALKRKGADWVGNPELSPSRNTGVDIALAFERTGFYVGAGMYANWVDDFITVHNQSRINDAPRVMNAKARSYANVDATLWGGEIDVVLSLTDQLFLSGDLSYVRGTKQASREQEVFSENIAEIPPLRSRISLRYEGGKWFGSVEGVFSARQDHVDTDLREEETPGYAIANFRVGARHDRFSLTLGVDNVFDELYIEHLSYQRDPFRSGARVPDPGRNLFVNVGFRF